MLQKALQQFTFLVFTILLSLFLVFIIFYVPETRRKTFEEVASTFTSAKTSRVDVLSRPASKTAAAE